MKLLHLAAATTPGVTQLPMRWGGGSVNQISVGNFDDGKYLTLTCISTHIPGPPLSGSVGQARDARRLVSTAMRPHQTAWHLESGHCSAF